MIVYDINSIPNMKSLGLAEGSTKNTIHLVLKEIPTTSGVLLWDSSNGGAEPKVTDEHSKLKVYDSNSKEGQAIIKSIEK